MNRRAFAGCALGVLGSAITNARQATGQSSTVQVQVNYTGSGAVDEKHKIWVQLWNSPDFMSGSSGPPMQEQSTSSKTGTVTFTNVQKPVVYVSAAYDPNGQWDGMSGPPPAGSSLGIYSQEPGKPAPVKLTPGTTSKALVSFNDAVKMPAH